MKLIGRVILIATTVVQFMTLVFLMCGHGVWLDDGRGNSSGMWEKCWRVADVHGVTIQQDCQRIRAGDTTDEYNTGRAFFVIAHFPAVVFLALAGVSVFLWHDSLLMDFSKAILALAQCGCILLAASIITADKSDEMDSRPLNRDMSWRYGCVLVWVAWCCSFVLLLTTILFILFKGSLRK